MCISEENICAGRDGSPAALPLEAGQAYTSSHWPLYRSLFTGRAKFYWERYKLPVCHFRNGMAGSDTINPHGEVHDPERIDFLKGYLGNSGAAVLMASMCADIFSVGHGQFRVECRIQSAIGMVYVDYSTQKRVVKDSGHWYKEVIASNGEFV